MQTYKDIVITRYIPFTKYWFNKLLDDKCGSAPLKQFDVRTYLHHWLDDISYVIYRNKKFYKVLRRKRIQENIFLKLPFFYRDNTRESSLKFLTMLLKKLLLKRILNKI